MKKIACLWFCFLWVWAGAQTPPAPLVCADCIRKNMEFLASDDLRGRGSGTEDEYRAAQYIGTRLSEYHIQPAGPHGYVQKILLTQRIITSPPTLMFRAPGTETPAILKFARDFLTLDLVDTQFSGPLQKINVDSITELPQARAGAVLLLIGKDRKKLRSATAALLSSPAAAILVPSSSDIQEEFQREGEKFPELPSKFAGQAKAALGERFDGLALSRAAIETLSLLPEGTALRFRAAFTRKQRATWNAVGMLAGSDPSLQHAAILFSAHLDHLGVGKPVNGDSIYNGADDDASGCSAVLEIARVLGSQTRPKRTVLFALFGSEEVGGTGSTYFREHPPVPLSDLAANLGFEMIGRADPAVHSDTLWLTGWERSNLGPTLASHGARLVGDPHPEQEFFSRSDNYVLARKGVVAQTISSYGLHPDYHQPSDDISHIDFKHMEQAIGSLLGPIEWLVNSDFKPQWNPGGQP